MNKSSGAGVNAGSIVDLKFTASDSLSELVWSPHKGLSLKCAEGSLPDKKSFLLWNVGPSNMIPSPSQSIRCKGIDDDKIVAGNLVVSQGDFHFDNEVVQRSSLTESPRDSAKPIVGSSDGQNSNSKDEMEEVLVTTRIPNACLLSEDEKEVCDPRKEKLDYMAERSKNSTGQLIPNFLVQGHPDSTCGMAQVDTLSGNLNEDHSSDLNHMIDNAFIGCQNLEKGTLATEVHTQIPSEAHISPLQISPCPDTSTKEEKGAIEEERKSKFRTRDSMVPTLEKLEYTAENDLQHTTVNDAYQQSEERLLRRCSVPVETNTEDGCSNFYASKGKDKALSEGNASGRFLDDEDDSQESLESCNSACFLGKRRWNFDQQLMVKNKRMKKDIDGNTESTSIMGHDSSFMNWISNMVKGFSKSNHEDGPSLDLTLAGSSHDHTSIIQENVICSRQQDPVSRNMGFQTMFQSLYCASSKLLEAGNLKNDCSIEGGQWDPMHVDDIDVHSSPNFFSGQNGVSCDHFFITNEKILPSTREAVAGQSGLPLILSTVSPIQNDFRTDSVENKDSINQECCEGKSGTSVSVSLGDHKITITENDNPSLASDGIAACELSNKGNMFGSLWITRFSTKARSTSLNLDNSNKEDCKALQRPSDCTMLNPQSQTNPDFPIEEKHSDTNFKSNVNSGDMGKELQTFAASAESSLGLKDMHERNYQNAVLKLNSVLQSHKFKPSEAMASIFARRLDALKHIIPSVVETDASSRAPICFLGGRSGHNLHAFSEVMGTELGDLLKNKRKSFFVEKEDNFKVAASSREKPCINTYLGNLYNEQEFSGRRSFSSNETQNQINSNSGENKRKDHHNLPLLNLVNLEMAEVPIGMFDAMRRLQVTRADVLKWINSHASLSHLEGLFLRLRLGKWEAGLDGTGYYVACITVEQAGDPVKACKESISVNIGGMKCLVGSQYISNHDILEDELMAWWCRILKSGGKAPSKEDLESKFKHRITLGL